MNLTEGQLYVLERANRLGLKKESLPHSKFWRNLDQLEKHGLVRRGFYGFYTTTDKGREMLRQINREWV